MGKWNQGGSWPYPNWGVGRVLISFFCGRYARSCIDHWVCDAWPMRRQTYSYLPSLEASLPFDQTYQIILLGEQRHIVCEQLAQGYFTWQRIRWESNQMPRNRWSNVVHKILVSVNLAWFYSETVSARHLQVWWMTRWWVDVHVSPTIHSSVWTRHCRLWWLRPGLWMSIICTWQVDFISAVSYAVHIFVHLNTLSYWSLENCWDWNRRSAWLKWFGSVEHNAGAEYCHRLVQSDVTELNLNVHGHQN